MKDNKSPKDSKQIEEFVPLYLFQEEHIKKSRDYIANMGSMLNVDTAREVLTALQPSVGDMGKGEFIRKIVQQIKKAAEEGKDFNEDNFVGIISEMYCEALLMGLTLYKSGLAEVLGKDNNLSQAFSVRPDMQITREIVRKAQEAKQDSSEDDADSFINSAI